MFGVVNPTQALLPTAPLEQRIVLLGLCELNKIRLLAHKKPNLVACVGDVLYCTDGLVTYLVLHLYKTHGSLTPFPDHPNCLDGWCVIHLESTCQPSSVCYGNALDSIIHFIRSNQSNSRVELF